MRGVAAFGALIASLSICGSAQASLMSGEGPRAPSWVRAAVAPEPKALTGAGTGFKLVGNLPLQQPTSGDVAASDIEMHGDHAFIGSYTEGLVIADISDPTRPKRAGVFSCGGGSQYDVQLSQDGNLAVLSTDSPGADCLPAGKSGSMIIDVSDRTKPVMVSFVEIAVGTHTQTLDDRTLYVNNYPASYSKLEIFDLTDPARPTKVSELSFKGEDSVHDSYVDHRPDGRTLLYAASIGYTDVIDVTDIRKPLLLQRRADPTVTISHQAEPNFRRDTLVVTDEFLGGTDAPACGRLPVPGEGALPLPALPRVGDLSDVGAIHFYKLDAGGSMVNGGSGDGKVGTYNIPTGTNPSGGCTVHVLWQAPDQNRLVAAWYGQGIHVIDYSDPSRPVSKAAYIPTGANTWAAKPHRVNGKAYVFTGDIARGMDVLEYTGDAGWPATAGPQEKQRQAIQGAPQTAPAPVKSVPAVSRGRRGFSFKTRVKVPEAKAERRTLTVTFTNGRDAVVSKLRFRRLSGRRTNVRARIAAVAGTYRFVVRVGDKGPVLRRGRLVVSKARASDNRSLGGRALVCRIL